jgi:hypothetical protein
MGRSSVAGMSLWASHNEIHGARSATIPLEATVKLR